jgi:hypothetical protein
MFSYRRVDMYGDYFTGALLACGVFMIPIYWLALGFWWAYNSSIDGSICFRRTHELCTLRVKELHASSVVLQSFYRI